LTLKNSKEFAFFVVSGVPVSTVKTGMKKQKSARLGTPSPLLT
jgi:hypothetical protein